MNIDYIKGEDLVAAPWRCTHVLKPDLEVLVRSMIEYGWLTPIVARKANNMIIDGHHRWQIAANVKEFRKATKGVVPVHYIDCNEYEAMMMHARLNRGRGSVTAKPLSNVIKRLLLSKIYNEESIRFALVMKNDELDLMIDGTLLKSKKVADHKYSQAWVPVEAPASITETSTIIERPPNPDR